MKIGIITNLYPPYARGGAEMVIVRTVGELLAMGHDVFVISGAPRHLGSAIFLDRSSGAERIYRFFPKNIYFTLDDYKYPALTRLLWHFIDAFSRDAAKSVDQLLDEERPDVVITHNLKGLGLRVPEAIRARNIPHVHVVHDLQLSVPSGLLMFGEEKAWLLLRPLIAAYRAFCRYRLKSPDVVIFPSHYLESMYKKYGFFPQSEIVMLPNPVPRYLGKLSGDRVPGPTKLLFAGQLASHKGVEFLLDAIGDLPFPAKLLIAGDGPLRERVEERASKDKRVTYLGYTPTEELFKVFSVVDVIVVPSLCYENSPTVIYEAFQSGIPVIASRIGGVGELITEGKNGFLFNPGDRADFVRAAKLLDERREDFGHHRVELRESVAPYMLDRYARRLSELLTLAIEKRKNGTG